VFSIVLLEVNSGLGQKVSPNLSSNQKSGGGRWAEVKLWHTRLEGCWK